MFRPLRPALMLLTLAVSGCTCGPLADGKLFGCETDFDCTAGFACVSGVCRNTSEPGGDAGVDAGRDGGMDAGTDAGVDAGSDAGVDAGSDAGVDAGSDAGVDAGIDAGVDAGTDAGVDAGTDAGFDAGTGPTRLTIDSAPQTVTVFNCSAPVQVTTRDDADASVAVQAPTTLSLGPAALRFFTTAGCDGGAVTSLSLAADASTQFFVRALDAGTFSMSVSALNLTQAIQTLTAAYKPIADGGFTGLPRTERAGDCAGPVSFTIYDDQNQAAKSTVPLNVSLNILPAPGITFYASAGCTTAPTNTVVIPAGASTVNFWMKGLIGRGYFVGAGTAGVLDVSGYTVLPVVRSIGCQLDDGGTTLLCPINPPQRNLANTFLSLQSASATNVIGEASLQCDFADAGLVTCVRANAGSSLVQARLQTVELPLATVMRGSSINQLTNLLPSVVPANRDRTFTLLSSTAAGVNLDENDLIQAYLNDAGTLELTHGPIGAAASISVQLVTVPGVQVFRGLVSMFGLSRLQISTSGVRGDLALTSARVPGTGTGLCDRFFRTEVLDAGLVFTRNCPTNASMVDAGIGWERLSPQDAGSTVSVLVSMAAGQTVATVPLPRTVDPSRTWLFTTGQAVGGQSGGEAAALGDLGTTDVLGEATVLLTTDGGSVRVERLSAADAGFWTVQGLEFNP